MKRWSSMGKYYKRYNKSRRQASRLEGARVERNIRQGYLMLGAW